MRSNDFYGKCFRRVGILSLCLPVFAACNNASHQTTFSPNTKKLTKEHPYVSTGVYFLADKNNGMLMKQDGSGTQYYIDSIPFAGVENIDDASLQETRNGSTTYTEICLKFNAKGTKQFVAGTSDPLHSKIAMVVANHLLYVVDNKPMQINGTLCVSLVDYTKDEMNAMLDDVKNKR